MSRSIIEVNNLSVRYPLRREPAIRNLSFKVAQGETVLILGPSGSGKSTLVLTLNGLIPHDIEAEVKGHALVAALDTATASLEALTSKVGVVFQDPEAQFCTLTVADEVAFGLENLNVPREEMDNRIRRALEQVGLEGMEHRSLLRLSGGEKQRLALAAILAMKPEIIILDEPTANLDPSATAAFFRMLAPLRGKHTILIVEHKLDECIDLVDRVLVLTPGGSLLTEGAPRDVFATKSARLREYGVWVPQVTEWALTLRSRGVVMNPLPLTVEEAVRAAHLLEIPVSLRRGNARTLASDGALAAQVRSLSFTYPIGERPALRSASMEVPGGGLFALVGPNGSGKSTLASHLIAINPPPPGKVFVFGQDVSPEAGMSLARLTELVGYVFQNPEHQFVTDRVYDELAYGLRVRGYAEEEIHAKVQELLEDFQLEALAEANPFTLSQGQKRRLSVATMLAVGQKLLVLDEPTFGQDRLTTDRMVSRWRRLQEQGITVLFITHNMRLVLDVAEKVAVLSEGRIIYQGEAERLYGQDELLRRARLMPPPLYQVARALEGTEINRSAPLTIDADDAGDHRL